ncbi:OPT oligopeptide transporter [Stereum hirsutum FP-91666 SS1]|uniref:OPT oligopeptide transporter n=1 Tax=Stereum hirsutum (strain FP-91666) TaxID=721885 RepID=UPI000440B92C|nr:OPT oligopeptide transporter [Stereum hirsutum FP-91666 SS1]EIM92043.1 OPT oligopeptide transporter [Stereum hirsutum FP-91666 SS1]
MSEPLSPVSGGSEKHSRDAYFQGEKEAGLGLRDVDSDIIAEVTGAQFDDPNLDKSHLIDLDDESPYPEVRSAVANTDDPTLPVSSLRTWIIGLCWAIIIPGLNQFYFFRFPAVNITGIVAQLLSFPIGRAWAAYMPNVKIFGVSVNPGPFSVKEHVLITIMASVGSGSAYATDIIAVQRVYYNQNYNFIYQWMVVMSTQLIGFSIGGVAKRFLVSPPSMIWPANLVSCALFNTLHSQQYSGIGTRGGLSRERFFVLSFIGAFSWYFLPGYLFQALSFFSWVTWIRPENTTISQLFGYVHGLGMSVVTFDWSQIAVTSGYAMQGGPKRISSVVSSYFSGLSHLPYIAFMPISSRTSYDNTGAAYDLTRILNPDSTLNAEAYHSYSPLFLSTTFAMSYGLSFASITATLMHALLYFRKQIWVQSRRSLHEQPDIHARLMSRYRQVPDWWYLVVFVSMFVFGIISIEVWPTQMPIWAFVLGLLISFTYVIPVGMIQAITNQQVGLNVITELIIGYALPGRPIAMMMFKTWGYITMAQALTFTSDFKLGHYMKIPPRPMFWSQIVATVIAGTVQLGVQAWMFTNIPDMCAPDQPNGFICPSTEVFGTASIIWALLFFFLVGTVAPVIPWIITKKWPNSMFKYINFPVIFNGTGLIPPATAVNYVPWAVVGFIFQYVIRRRHFDWWTKYNYVLSAAMDSGTAVSILVIFFCLQFPMNGQIGINTIQSWWGNTVPFSGADNAGTPISALPPQGTFG